MQILSLRDAAQSQVREQFWSAKTRDDRSDNARLISQETWSATAVLKRLLGDSCAGFEVAKIKDYRDGAALVRCLQPALRKVRTARNEKPANIPPDPFC